MNTLQKCRHTRSYCVACVDKCPLLILSWKCIDLSRDIPVLIGALRTRVWLFVIRPDILGTRYSESCYHWLSWSTYPNPAFHLSDCLGFGPTLIKKFSTFSYSAAPKTLISPSRLEPTMKVNHNFLHPQSSGEIMYTNPYGF